MSITSSIKNALVPIHPAGYPFIAAFFIAAIVLGWVWDPLFYVGLALTAWCAYFFRDPERVTQVNDDLVISPADGKISNIGKAIPPRELGLGDEPLQRISVFMNVFSCHVNRSPVKGRITKAVHKAGSFLNAELDKASEENERNSLIINSAHGDLVVVQVAGLVARRIICWSEEGEELSAGERFGLIRFGSRLDIYLPKTATVSVGLGQSAIAGETILARFDELAVLPVTRVS